MKKPLIVGITGGIGGGKSTFSNMLRERGFLVYDTDKEAKRLQNENVAIKQELIRLFGENIYTSNGLDRKRLAELVFNDSDLLKQLNRIVHPVVQEDFLNWQGKHAQEKYLFVESAILFESGFNQLTDIVIVITATENIRIERIVSRDKISQEAARKRVKNQLPEEDKIRKADITVYTDCENALSDNINPILEKLNFFLFKKSF